MKSTTTKNCCLSAPLKKALKITGIALGILLLLIIVTPVLLRGKIEAIARAEVSNMVNAKVDFDKLGISLIRNFPKASLDLKGLSIVGVEPFEGDTLLQAERISVVVDVMSLFGDLGFEVSKVVLQTPRIRALVNADGKANWDIIKDTGESASTQDQEPSSFRLSLKELRINSGGVAYFDQVTKMQFLSQDINVKLSGDMSADQATLNLAMNAAGIYFVMDNTTFVNNATAEIKANIAADMKNGKYTLHKNTISLNTIKASLDGWVAIVGDAVDMDIKLNSEKIAFKDILSMIPAFYTKDFKNLTASGGLQLEAWAKGRLEGESLPAFNASLKVSDGSFKYADLPKSVDNINIAASVSSKGGSADNTVIDLSAFSLSMAGQALSGSLWASTPLSDINFRAAAKGTVNMGAIKEVYPLNDSIKLSGILTADIKVAARMSAIEKKQYDKIDAQGLFTIEKMEFKMSDLPKIDIERASATITSSVMTLSQTKAQIGASDISASGQLSNYLGYALKDDKLTGHLNVKSTLLDLNELMGYTPQTQAAADTVAMTAFEVPKNIDLSLSASLDKVLFQKMVLTNLNGEISVAEGTVRMKKLDINAVGGKLTASGSYSTANSPLTPEVAMVMNFTDASFSQTFKELDMVKKFVPVFETTGGNYSLSLDMQTTLDSQMSPDLSTLKATGVLRSSNIQVQNIKAFEELATLLKDDRLRKIEAKDVNIPFSIAEGRIATKPFDLKLAGANINMNGTTGLDQSIDYTALVTLPPGTAGGYLSKVSVLIGGTFTSPKITLGVKDMIQDALTQTINRELDKLTGSKGINEEISKQSEKLRSQAQAAGDKLIEIAREQGEKLINEAKNPLIKLAAQKSADALVKKAQQQAAKLLEEAEKSIANLQNKQTEQ